MTQAEIKAYQDFAALPLSERRRRIYAKFAKDFPNSPLTFDYLTGRVQLPKKRGRKPTGQRKVSRGYPTYNKGIQSLLDLMK